MATFERELAWPDSRVAGESSTVSAAAYDAEACVLMVLFSNGSMYFFGFPVWIYEALLEAQPDHGQPLAKTFGAIPGSD